MRMKSRLYTSLLIAASIACGCQGMEEISEMPVRFTASVQQMSAAETDGTKGTLWNESGSDKPLSDYTNKFYVSVWNNVKGSSAIPTGTEVNYANDIWQPKSKYFWVENVEKTVFAYANTPASGCGVLCNSKNNLSMTLVVPETADAQTDILLGAYTGISDKGCADIHFVHPLTSVRFKKGVIAGGVAITRLSITKVAYSGNIKLYPDGSLSSWTVSDYDKSVSQSKESGLVAGDGSIGEPFLLIPQDLVENPVRVVLELSDGNVVTTSLKSGKWLPGTAYTYTIDYDNPD